MLRRAFLATLLSVALVLSAASRALAQNPDSAKSDASIVPALGVRIGAVVRVAHRGGTRVEGPLLRATNNALVLGVAQGEQVIPINAGDSVWVSGRATKRGAITGGALGLALTGAAVALFYATCKEGTDDPCTGQDAFVPLGIGTVGGGALLGAAVGALIPRWHRRQP